MSDFFLIKDLLSWVIDHSNFTFPYASSVPLRALVFFAAITCIFVTFWIIAKLRRKKNSLHLQEETSGEAGHVKKDGSKKRRILFQVLVVVVIFFMVASIRTSYMTKLGKILFYDHSTQVIVEGDYNWIDLDPENNLLYVAGHSTDQVLAYDTNDLSRLPRTSEATSEHAQSFALNIYANELYYPTADEIIVFGIPDLTVKEALKIPPLSPGDVWIVWDQKNGQIIISSEADVATGNPFLVVDRSTGDIVFDKPLQAWNIYLNPSQPILYMGSSFHDDTYYLLNTEKLEIVSSFQTGEFGNRMVLDERNDELLIATPFKSKIIRYNPITFANIGAINGNIGVRSVAIDQANSLLFVGSIVDNTLRIIDLSTYKTVRSYWVGPWVRSIVLDPENRMAYVSTRYDVICVAY